MQVWLDLRREPTGHVMGSVRIEGRNEIQTFSGWLELLRLLEPDGESEWTSNGSQTQRRTTS
jgi:hypothetical protein